MKTADQLKIKGLCESPEEKNNSDQPPDFTFGGRGYPKIRKLSSPKQFKSTENNRKHKYRKPERRRSPNQEDKENKDSTFANHSSDEENDMPVALDEENRKRKTNETMSKPVNMTSHGPLAEQVRIFSDTDLEL